MTVPAKSVKQFKFMKRCETSGKCPPGLSPQEAKEFTHGQSPKHLPEKKTPRGHPKKGG